MDLRNSELAAPEVRRAQTNREKMVERLARAIRNNGATEPLPGLRLRRASSSTGLAMPSPTPPSV